MDLVVGDTLTRNILVNSAALRLPVGDSFQCASNTCARVRWGRRTRISSGATPNFHDSAMARTGVRVPTHEWVCRGECCRRR